MMRAEDARKQLEKDHFFLTGGGDTGARIRALDWSATSLGPVEHWPQSLKTSVSTCLNSRFAILIWWGRDLVMIYNDAYASIIGDKHPSALGAPGRTVWPEVWQIIGPMLEGVIERGEATWSGDLLLELESNGYLEERYFTFSYSPIRDESGGVGGVFTPVQETTAQVIGARRLRTLRDLSEETRIAKAQTSVEVCRLAAETLSRNAHDIPFAAFYLFSPDRDEARLAGFSGFPVPSPLLPEIASARDPNWTFAAGFAALPQIIPLPPSAPDFPRGPWSVPPEHMLLQPISPSGETIGFMALGVSPRKRLDADYRTFLDFIAQQVNTAIAEALALEQERKRAEALAEIDRAKTAFFSNVSHEFRTPLTLMLGPLEEMIGDAHSLPAEHRSRLDIAHRNSLRLLRLVNTLLDFSRIEAGRTNARYVPVDLASLTSDLASNFRSLIESGGLEFVVDCRPLPHDVYIDVEMWEKIVLNLLSNAFKFTHSGRVTVRLAADRDHATLQVEDTGTGIPETDLAHIFERFHRVEGAAGRTYEGTGIGLALVQELVKLHGGTIDVRSRHGEGSTFTVAIPFGSAHLATERIGREARGASSPPQKHVRLDAFTSEAAAWIPMRELAPSPATESRPKILIADDNADMRRHLIHILRDAYELTAVADGRLALESARRERPGLILCDVMMPVLDGLELLRQLRADPELRDVPVILLSARAGDEARIEGINAGADDYITKPFNAAEVQARIKTALELERVRRQAREEVLRSEQRYRQLAEQVADGIFVSDGDGRFVDANDAASRMLGYTHDELLQSSVYDVLTPEEGERLPAQFGKLATGEFVRGDWRFRRKDGSILIGDLIGRQLRDGRLQGIVRDVTERRREEERLRNLQLEQEFLLEVSDALRPLTDAVEIQVTAARLLGARLQANRVLYAEIDGDVATVHRDYVNGLPSIAGRFDARDFGESVVGAYRRGELLNMPDIQNDPALSDHARRSFAALGVRSNLSRGLLKNGEWVAALTAHHATARAWSELEISLLEQTAQRAWDAVERARAEQAVRDHELTLQSFYDSAPLLMGLAEIEDDRVVVVSGNRAVGQFVAKNPEELPGKTGTELGASEGFERLWIDNYRRSQSDNAPVRFEYEQAANEGQRWMSATVAFIGLGSGGRPRFCFVIEDVTTRKEAERRERAAVAKFESVFNQSGIFEAILDCDGAVLEVNDLALDFCGYSRDDVLGRRFWETGWWQGSEVVRAEVRKAVKSAATGITYRDILHYWKADGTERIVEFAIYPIRDESGAVQFLHPTGIDITERVEAEQTLQKHRELLEIVVHHIPAGVCLVRGSDLRLQIVNPAYQAIAPWKEMAGKTLDEVWPETARDFSEMCRGVLETGEPHEAVDEAYAIQRRPGAEPETAYFSWSIHRVPLPGGEWGLLNAAWDTTARMKTESALRESEATLRAFLENSPMYMGVTELVDGDVLHAYDNPATCRFFGVEPGATSGKLAGAELGADLETVRLWTEAYRTSEATGQPARFEYHMSRPAGARWLSVTVCPMDTSASGRTRFCYVAEDVTDRKNAEELLRESEAFLAKVLDSSLNGVYVYDFERGSNTFMNRQYEVLTGYTREQIDTMPAAEFFSLFHEEDAPRVAAHMRDVLAAADGRVLQMEYRFRAADGHWMWCLSHDAVFARSADGSVRQMIGAFVDITARKQAETALAESEARFRTVTESMPQLVWSCTPDGLCDYLSSQWVAYTGVSAADQLGYRWLERVHPDDRSDTLERWTATAKSGGEYDAEFRVLRHDGAYRWFKSRANPQWSDGEIVRWFGTCTDIDDQKRVEQELRRANSDLEQFAYSASHDLQEPLRNVAVYSQLLDKRHRHKLDGEAEQFLNHIVGGARRMSNLVSDLLAFTRAASEDETPVELTSSEAALDRATTALAQTIAETGAVVTRDPLPPVHMRASHLEQLLQNLIGNGIKYCKESEPPCVHVRAERQEAEWRFSVSDNGIGIAPEFHDRIFGLFKRLHGGKYAGTGIGLAICQKIVERYGGRIWVESEPGAGSVFVFSVPHKPIDRSGRG